MTAVHNGTKRLFAPRALIGERFHADVAITIDPTGEIAAVEPGPSDEAETVPGLVIPGAIDVHCHAFQRAMVGLTQRAGPADDDFWTWREAMYRFVAAVEPDDLEAIAAGLYVDLLKHGFTSVGEFHYLHNAGDGRPYADQAEMSERIVAAARAAGIGLTLLPALYQAGAFGGAPPKPGQRRFVLGTEAFLRLIETCLGRYGGDPNTTIGIAPHSLRAVAPAPLRTALDGISRLAPEAPVHMHVAEQTGEVAQCLAWSGARPMEWLARNIALNEAWCLIHATHTSLEEKRAIAAAGAVVCLCPATEADLGDGIFDLPALDAAGGRFGIGTDANVAASPATELRQLEWSQRLALRRRIVAERREGASTGAALYLRALEGGARALGRRIGKIAPGHRADLLVLDLDHPLLAARHDEEILDSWIFTAGCNPVRDVMVGGRWVVREGRHVDEGRAGRAFRDAMRRLAQRI